MAHVRLTSTHSLCFEAKIRKIGIPQHIPVLLKVGYKVVYIIYMCVNYPDGTCQCSAHLVCCFVHDNRQGYVA